jgi:hypothetical protein
VAFGAGGRFAAAVGLLLFGAAPAFGDADLGSLARCISASGAIFYGAHWCPVCAKQKEYFDGYAYLLPYVECYDGPKKDGRNARCKKLGIEHYPTWVFPDGSVQTGARTPENLAAKTGCRLRQPSARSATR